jgi:hypothetical protein
MGVPNLMTVIVFVELALRMGILIYMGFARRLVSPQKWDKSTTREAV